MKVEDILNEAWGGRRAYPGKRMVEAGQHIADAINQLVAAKFKDAHVDFETGEPTGDDSQINFWSARAEMGRRWQRTGPGINQSYADPSASIRLTDHRSAMHGLAGYKEEHQRTTKQKANRRLTFAKNEMLKYLKRHGQKIDLEDFGMTDQVDGYKIGKYIYVPGPSGAYIAMYSPNKLKGLLRQRSEPVAEPV